MLLNDKIKVNISFRNITHYRKLGYNPVLNKKLEIDTSHLPSSSHVKVLVKCELCNNTRELLYCKYVENKKRYGFYSCKSCSRNKAALTNLERYGVDNYSKTDEYKRRVEKTNIKKFGYKTNLINPEYQKRIKNILNSKYGTENFYEIKGNSVKNKFTLNDDVYELIDDLNLIEEEYDISILNDDYLLYRRECRRLTNKNIKTLMENWDGRDYYDNEYILNNFELSHNDPRYPTIDHKISIYYGFVNKIPSDSISSLDNLCLTKRSINSSKREKLDYNPTNSN